MPKTVFIAHPIGGDVEGNVKKVLQICKEVHTEHVIPVATYLVAVQYLDDAIIADRELGVAANLECFHRRYIDELWLYGDRISPGMREEVDLAHKLGIPVVPKTRETAVELEGINLMRRAARDKRLGAGIFHPAQTDVEEM